MKRSEAYWEKVRVENRARRKKEHRVGRPIGSYGTGIYGDGSSIPRLPVVRFRDLDAEQQEWVLSSRLPQEESAWARWFYHLEELPLAEVRDIFFRRKCVDPNNRTQCAKAFDLLRKILSCPFGPKDAYIIIGTVDMDAWLERPDIRAFVNEPDDDSSADNPPTE